MRFKVLVTIMLVTFLFALPVNANSVTTTSTTFDIIAGDSIDINYTINYTDSTDTTCYVSTSISPDDVGITLTYIPSFVLKSQTSTLYYIYVDTSMLLVPGTYILTTTFQTEGSEPIIIRHHTYSASQGNVTVIPPIDETTPPEDNETIPPLILPTPTTEDNQFEYWWIIILIIIITGIILLFFYLRKRSKRT
jgi:hypothetical protein